MASDLLPDSEFKRLKRIVLNGVSNDDLLNPFWRSFLNGFLEKFDKYERHTFVSDKQAELFDTIEEKLKSELGEDYE